MPLQKMPLQKMKNFLRAHTPRVVAHAQRARSGLDRLRHGDGDVAVFERIATENRWRDPGSRSGAGSSLDQTATIRREIPSLLRRVGARSLLDAPCGDFHWMSMVELTGVDYLGVDLVPSIVQHCQEEYGSPVRRFEVRNIIDDPLPKADVILCRDCLVHLSYRHIAAALANFRASGATYLLTTSYRARTINWNVVTGKWRPLNLEKPPFGFPVPLERIVEESTEIGGHFADKILALWRLDALPAPGTLGRLPVRSR
jgi:hypothetical protein